MYYSYDNCLEKKALFNFITGERGNGKTYGYKTQIACKNYFEKVKILSIYEDLKTN